MFLSYGVSDLAYQDTMKHGVKSFDKVTKKSITDYTHLFHQAENKIKDTWTLLDSQSTVDVIVNQKMLINIQEINVVLKI